MPFCHPYLHEIVRLKGPQNKQIEAFLQEEKHKLIQMEDGDVCSGKNTRISTYRSIL